MDFRKNKKNLEKQRKKFREAMLVVFEAFAVSVIVLASLGPVSCKVTAEGIKMLEGDYAPPVLQSFSVLDTSTLEMCFSESVVLSDCVVSPFIEGVSDSMESSCTEELSDALAAASGAYGSIDTEIEYSEEHSVVYVRLVEEMETGKKYELYGKVTDNIGNTLTFSFPFVGFNARIPMLIMTEIQSETISGQKATEKSDGTYRTEFIEFLALSDGNLAGLEICSGYDGAEKNYIFPAVEVRCGEVFVVHLRNKGNGCVDETGEDLSLAFGIYTDNDVRDLWSEKTATALGNKTDVILLRNRADNKVLDAVFYAAEGEEEWQKSMGEFAELAVQYGIYDSTDISEAFCTAGLTATKTICRTDCKDLLEQINQQQEIEFPVKNNRDFWTICSEGTPGHL